MTDATVSFDLGDALGDAYDFRRTKVWLTFTTANGRIVDAEGQVRVGAGFATINADGTGTLEGIPIPGGTNPESYQCVIHYDAPPRAGNQRNVQRERGNFGPMTITADADLAVLMDQQEVPPNYQTTLTDELQTYVDAARDISNIAVDDDIMTIVDGDPATEFRVQSDARLDATFAPKWKASTVYSAGATVLAPDGSLVKAKVAFTSGTTYSAANWTSVVSTDGTQAKGELDALYATDNGARAVGKGELVYNVKDYSSLASALAAVPSGSSIYLPAGTYSVNNLIWPGKDVTLIGDGPRKTILQVTGGYGIVNPTAGPAALTLRNLGMVGGTYAQLRLSGSYHTSATFVDVRFSGFVDKNHYAVENNGASASFTRCEFDGQGTGLGTAIYTDYGVDLEVKDCVFRYLFRGVYGSDTNAPPASITVDRSRFDGGWCYLLPHTTGTGTSYTSTTVTSAGKFGATTANHTIRAMTVKRAGTATLAGRRVEDLSANFTTSGVQVGDIVRMATGWGAVARVISATRLVVEEWLTLTTFQSMERPDLNGSGTYTVYGLVIGKVVSATADTATVGRWRNWTGGDVTPTASTLFEVCANSDYPVFVLSGQRVKITNNTLRRGWSDQISLQRCVGYPQVLGNTISDGQDVGITIEDAALTGLLRGVMVANNTISHQGSAGIFFGRTYESQILGNQIVNSNWMSTLTSAYGAIQVETASNLNISNNIICSYDGNPNTLKAIHLSLSSANVSVVNNRSVGIPTTLLITGASVTGVTGVFIEGTTVLIASSGFPPLGDFTGIGVPTMSAATGSTYRRRGGAAGASFYVVEAGSWVAK